MLAIDSCIDSRHLRLRGLTEDDTLGELRQRCVFDLEHVRYLLYEVKGGLTIVPTGFAEGHPVAAGLRSRSAISIPPQPRTPRDDDHVASFGVEHARAQPHPVDRQCAALNSSRATRCRPPGRAPLEAVRCDSGNMRRPRLPPNRARIFGPVALVVACGVAFVTAYAVTVRTAPGREFGDASLRGALITRSGVAAAVDSVLGVVSIASLLAGIAGVAMVALARLQRVPGGVAVGLVVAANASTWLLKNHLLSRPDLGLSEVTPATHNSLPSGHTTAVFSVAVALLFVVPASWRRLVAIAGGAGSIMMALATLSAGWHRAGDSIAAFALVGAWAGLAALVVTSLDAEGRKAVPRSGPDLRSPGWLVALTAVSGGGAVCLAVGLVLIPALRASAVGAVAAFLAGALLIIAAGVAVLIGVQSVLAIAGGR